MRRSNNRNESCDELVTLSSRRTRYCRSVPKKRSRPSLLFLAVALFVSMYALVGVGGSAGAATPSWEPVYNQDFPDPAIMVYNGTEYAYSTNSDYVNTPWATSTDSTQWTSGASDAFPALPSWSLPNETWAPSVELNAIGQFVMWYTIADAATGTQCISRAVSSSPAGPFTDTNLAPPICQAAVGSIDPEIFTAPSGQSYLYWKSDGNSVGEPSLLWGEALDANLNLIGSPTVMLRADQTWQQTIIEAPDMWYANGVYYLFYSSNAYNSAFDAIGYATCTSPLGSCQDSLLNPVLESSAGMSGPGGPSLFDDPGGALRMAFDAWPGAVGYANGGYRALYMATVTFGPSGQPVFTPDNPTGASVPVNRIYGQDAIGTSIAVSQAEFPANGSAHAVVLARSDFFSDALAGGPLAAALGGPLLITPGASTSSALDPRVLAEIQRVLPVGDTVYVLGGDLALSPGIDSQLGGLGYTVVREAGADEYATAVDIANQLGDPPIVFEATGLNFYDALSAVPAAIADHGAILLTDGNVQAPETAAYLNQFHPSVRYTIGGSLAAGGADPGATNVSGADLFTTSAAVAATFFPNARVFGAATGATFPDALSGGGYMGSVGGPMLLVNPTTPLPPWVGAYLATGAGRFTRGTVFGGPEAVNDSVVLALESTA
jgi:hypothetical protein